MAELATREALQPSLLDRLTDRSRYLERVTIAYREQALTDAGLDVSDLREMFTSLGLVRGEGGEADEDVWDNRLDVRPFRRVMELSPRADVPAVESLIELRRRTLVPSLDESRDERLISQRRLRQMVLRDLGWLLNTPRMGELVDLSLYPEVTRSTLNYGVPDMTGQSLSGADLKSLADGLRQAIIAFEPRLHDVLVTPVERDETGRKNTIAFVIEGELWGQPLPEQLYLHTELDLEDASVTLRESNDR
ncbi:type VI secretion system lysozyme-like protein [Natronocella acetinitrilica]|jgi:type VI secretion system lysozyme-like protein|uniref:Type VI secretion system lysozyme-like protein n=1 Tax=Natronocella acetinitrilica TaxID=414046 RepID=A0AAE3G191_9GAMM|nr:type VI secretion system baseplate subunit TssE [Natronocella acetinitrilica]MCP1673930.1 type VI secretion system lysozyme-like protein [Natronocella acetinitrilica]